MNNYLSKKKHYAFLFFAYAIYSLTSIFSKLASLEDLFSVKYIVYYCCVIFILGFYAILWQQILKKLDLSIALLFKPSVLIFNCIWAYIFFNEEFSLKKIIGILIIVLGIYIVGAHDE